MNQFLIGYVVGVLVLMGVYALIVVIAGSDCGPRS